ncbi:MAG: hypothetical protein ACLS8T_23665 [Anaerobutyricum sp.]
MLTANYIGSKKVKTGMALWQANRFVQKSYLYHHGWTCIYDFRWQRNLFGVYGQDRAIWIDEAWSMYQTAEI